MKGIYCNGYISQTKNYPIFHDVGDRSQIGWYNLEAKLWEVPGHNDTIRTVE